MQLIGYNPLIYNEISDNSKKTRRLQRKAYEGKYDTRDKNLRTVLANSFITAAGNQRYDTECKKATSSH